MVPRHNCATGRDTIQLPLTSRIVALEQTSLLSRYMVEPSKLKIFTSQIFYPLCGTAKRAQRFRSTPRRIRAPREVSSYQPYLTPDLPSTTNLPLNPSPKTSNPSHPPHLRRTRHRHRRLSHPNPPHPLFLLHHSLFHNRDISSLLPRRLYPDRLPDPLHLRHPATPRILPRHPMSLPRAPTRRRQKGAGSPHAAGDTGAVLE